MNKKEYIERNEKIARYFEEEHLRHRTIAKLFDITPEMVRVVLNKFFSPEEISEMNKENTRVLKKNYSPKAYCKQCEDQLPFEKKTQQFCSQKCAGNFKRIYTPEQNKENQRRRVRKNYFENKAKIQAYDREHGIKS